METSNPEHRRLEGSQEYEEAIDILLARPQRTLRIFDRQLGAGYNSVRRSSSGNPPDTRRTDARRVPRDPRGTAAASAHRPARAGGRASVAERPGQSRWERSRR